jgi:hypothetical protein
LLFTSLNAYNLFKSSEVEEKRQLIKLLLQNLRIEGENLLWDVQKPFDLIVNCSDHIRNRLVAKALPDPDFKYFSNSIAVDSDLNAK